jgi:hypothetical protein
MTTKEYQNSICPLLQNKLPGLDINNEWISFRAHYNHYSLRVDIAVGPLSIRPGENKLEEYNHLIRQESIRFFLSDLYDLHIQNIVAFRTEVPMEYIIPDFEEVLNKNQNARCFLAIEIENQNSKKHIMGSLINAASLGRIGIGIAYSDKTLKTFIRIINYLGFLKRVEKNTYDTTNYLIVTKEQLNLILNK